MTARRLKAARYAEREGVTPGFTDLLLTELPFFSYAAALDFYADIVPRATRPELQLLGANDRFFLLTGLLNRDDALHPWVYDRCREVEADPDGYLDLWSRYHYKSTIITLTGSIDSIIDDPEITICIFGNTQAISRPFLAQIKDELERNECLKQLYDDVLWIDPKNEAPSWSIDRGITVKRKGKPKEATVEAHGVIDAIPTGKHFRVLDYDDMVTEHSVTNPDQIKKTTERYELSLSVGVGAATRIWMPGTRYSYADTYGQLISEEKKKIRLRPATHNGRLDGEPVMMSHDDWEHVKHTQRSVVAAQFLQDPLAGEENMFRAEWLRPFELRPRRMNVYIMADPSLGRSASSNRTAIAVVGVDTQLNRYLLDGYCHRMRLSARWAALKGLYRKWLSEPGVEFVSVGYERYGQQTDQEYFEERMQERGEPNFPIRELNWVREGLQSKPARVERIQPHFEHSQFFMPHVCWHQDHGTAIWSIDADRSVIQYRPYRGETSLERKALDQGEGYRLMAPIRRRDEDGNLYDLFRVFVEEFIYFPFSPRDDLIDAMSRIEDMDVVPPSRHEESLAAERATRSAPPDA